MQFKTAPKSADKPYSLIYLGDAQNDLFHLWSRMVREAYKRAPEAKFMLHGGDVINPLKTITNGENGLKQLFFRFKMMPQVVVPGNHKYIKNQEGLKTGIKTMCDPQFNFLSNGVEKLGDTNYYIDYLNMLVICLNSNEHLDLQRPWLEEVLKNNAKKWVVVAYHHPVMSSAKDRFNKGVI